MAPLVLDLPDLPFPRSGHLIPAIYYHLPALTRPHTTWSCLTAAYQPQTNATVPPLDFLSPYFLSPWASSTPPILLYTTFPSRLFHLSDAESNPARPPFSLILHLSVYPSVALHTTSSVDRIAHLCMVARFLVLWEAICICMIILLFCDAMKTAVNRWHAGLTRYNSNAYGAFRTIAMNMVEDALYPQLWFHLSA